MKILQVCAYAAPYEGNFMQSLFALEKDLAEKQNETIYAFPEVTKETDWCQKLMKRAKVYFLPLRRAQFNPNTYAAFKRIYKENKDISIVHSHFEQYDTPTTITAPQKVKVFWHLHDPVVYEGAAKRLLMRIKYGWIGQRAVLLSVSEKYRKDMIGLGFNEIHSKTILNGICTNRVKDNRNNGSKRQYDFITFGWNFYVKGDDIIIRACNRLYEEGYRFKFLLNGLEATWKSLDEYCRGNIPEYLIKGQPESDINVPLGNSSLFIQASRRETFSYSIAEAAYAGLPVISSDIPGVEWAHDIPTIDFFEFEDSDGLYRLLKEYLDGKCLDDTEVDETRRIIEEKYSVECWVKKIKECYGIY